MQSRPLVAGIEAGGTKFVCAVGTGPEDVRGEIRIPTTTPQETLQRTIDYLRTAAAQCGNFQAIGVGTFGPAGVNPSAADFGFITTTPKAGWQQTDVLGALRREFDVPMAFDTDVNAAAFGEWKWGAVRGCSHVLYLTIGTGIGGGYLIDGRPLHGLMHPEMGHIRIPHDRAADPFPGACPWHGDCLEGLASGFAMEKRWSAKGAQLPSDHPAWELEARYLALAVASFVCTLSPRRVILGGGVMEHPGLLESVRAGVADALGGYLKHDSILHGAEDFIVAPGLANRSGLLGAMAMAQDKLSA